MEFLHGELTNKIINCAMEVHRILGPGLLESTYEACLCKELELAGIAHARQLQLPVIYKGLELECGYRIDILVENNVLLELKTVEKILPVHEAQLITYLKLKNIKVGLILNFNVPLLKNGIVRRVI